MVRFNRIHLLIAVVVLSRGSVVGVCAQEAIAVSPAGNPGRAVILATQRDHRVNIFDAKTLLPLGSIVVNSVASHTTATPDGQTLFVAAAETKDGNVCCSMFALRLKDRTICPILFPAMQSTISPDGSRVYLQRGSVGIEMFDTHTLERLPTIRAPGVYRFLPSPDGRWLFGITYFQGPSLDIFSVSDNRMIQRLPLPKQLDWDGAWLNEKFVLFAHDGKQGELWTVLPQESSKGPEFCKQEGTCTDRPVALPDLASGGKPIGMRTLGGSNSLFVYEPLGWWFKLDRRNDIHAPFPGGIYKIDTVAAKVIAHFAPEMDFAQVIADPQGQFLYGLDAGRPSQGKGVRLLRLAADTGQVLNSEPLATDVWSITFAVMPTNLIPLGELQPQTCSSK